MPRKFLVAAALVAVLTAAPAFALLPPGVEVNPLVNGDFELKVPLNGEDVPVQPVELPTGVTCGLPVPDPGVGLGTILCYDLVGVDVTTVGDKPIGWSIDNKATKVVTQSLTNHHVRFLSQAQAVKAGIAWSDHRMWQSYAIAVHQAFSGDFRELSFDALSDITPNGGTRIQLSYSETPVYVQSPWLLIFIDDFNTFTFTKPVAKGTHVTIDPIRGNPDLGILASFQGAWSGAQAASAFNAPTCDLACKHQVLGGLREVQFSFWGFSDGADIDNVFEHGALPPTQLRVQPFCGVGELPGCLTG